ncbi:glycerophosphodiester phosphodiesterase [Shewanella maritima]|uniref:glycerophosphodiester phosphodiesterase n=1 Tax=Shewanella maritima TaxID=2520507 RepID=UPI003736EB3E
MLVFAHRGASGYQVENTLSAMAMALELGVKAIELDVHNVEDELYVFHDRRLDNKTTGVGPIHYATKDEIDQTQILGQPIPTLWQVLELIDGKCMVNIELKGCYCLEPFLQLYPKILNELSFSPRQILISAFNHHYLLAVRTRFPQAFIAPLIDGVPLNLAQAVTDLDAFSVHLSINFVNQAMVDDAHQRKAKVYVYTVDDADDIRALMHLKVDGIFSNYPDKAQAVIEQYASTPLAVDEDKYKSWFE